METSSIKFLKINSSKRINNSKGDLIKFINKKSKTYSGFGEIYFTFINYNKIKAWKLHTKMTMQLIVPIGKVKFVFFDEKFNKYKEVILSEKNVKVLTVPPNILFGFKGIKKGKSLLANLSNIVYDDKEVINYPIKYLKYDWKK